MSAPSTDVRRKSMYEEALEQGISRREFLKIASAVTLALGLDLKEMPKVVRAMETKPRIPVIWMDFQSCSGPSESFTRSYQPTVEKVLFDMISLEYNGVLMAGSGNAAEKRVEEIVEKYPGQFILAAEGSLPTMPGALGIAGQPRYYEKWREIASKAMAVVAVGSCATWGGIPAANPNPTGAKSVIDFVPPGVPWIRIPGCPPIGEVITNTLAHIAILGKLPEVDELGRPKEFFRHRLHDKCQRRPFFDAGLYVESFDDEGARQGFCLYKMGCRGPTTYNACAELRWNGGLSWPIQSGHPCIGCAAPNFWDEGPFYSRVVQLPGTQTTINPERVGLGIAAVAALGITAHAAASVVSRRRLRKSEAETAEEAKEMAHEG
ncbi:MAG: [Ni,Fe] uptake hydrogenase, small subunit [Brockia lithotrophica]|uniref:[Ni,Fe] uptake hydrogenase, small subunit n=1 Tax=Brockia lithotrophica TaxID=933949 RepID=A0A2T5G651_9BACL|nr:MAG: [Ni,Fe] uptake hydrogenase, small subunit [Brockia lithotrophica]